MRKKYLLFILTFIGILTIPGVANAELSCDASYRIEKDEKNCVVLNLNNKTYGMYTYNVAGHSNVKAYCIDPVKKSGVGNANCVRRIDPSSTGSYQAYDVAVTKAYQMLTNDKRNTTSKDDKVLGEVIFRWLGYYYGIMNKKASFTQTPICSRNNGMIESKYVLDIFNPDNYGKYWNGSSYGSDSAYAYSVYNAAKSAGNRIKSGATYDQLISDGTIWGDKYTIDSASQESEGTNVDKIKVKLTLANDVTSVNWSSFGSGCDNKNVVCATESVVPSGNSVTITIRVTKTSNYDGQDYQVYVQSSIYDKRSSSANMIIVSPNDSLQNMLLVSDSSSYSLWGGSKIRITTTPGNSNIGGKCKIENNTYYCNDGQPCSEPEYRADCGSPDDGTKVNCTPTMTMPSSCNNFDAENETTGIISDINEVNSSCNTTGVNQVKKCVLGHNDLTNTSFESTSELSGNNYCKVYCKEKYTFNVPTAKITRSGGYFTLSTTINGERDCYVASADETAARKGTGIDTAKFKADLISLRIQLINDWNNYSYYKAAYEAANSDKYHEETKSVGPGTCSHSCGTNEDGSACVEYENDGATGSYTLVTIDEWSAVQYSPSTGNIATNRTGSYQSGSGSCGCSSCTINDGVNPSDEYKGEMEKYESLYKNDVAEINKAIQNYNSCSGAVDNSTLDALTSGITTQKATSNDDTSWSNNMQFDPKVTFKYNEAYKDQINGELTQKSKTTGGSETYCSGDISDDYTCTSGASSSVQTTTTNTVICNTNGCQSVTVNISNANYVQKSKTASATYEPDHDFATYTPYGTIKFKNPACKGNDCLWSKLPENALPVSMITKTGVFPFVINFSNIGQDNKTGALGRLMGASTSVLTEYDKLDENVRCPIGSTSETMSQNAGYVCHYLTNCDNCKFTCTDKNNCEFIQRECTDDNCTLTCKNCLFDGETNNFTYRTVSVNNLNPNTRSLGYNWSNVKGEATKKEIEATSDTIYEKPQYSYTLTPTNLKNIREYNDDAGSYTNAEVPNSVSAKVDGNASLYCETMDYNGVEDGVTYKCRSRFLDLIEKTGKKYSTTSYRITSDSNEGTNAYESFEKCSSGYGIGDCEYIGPSWRIKEVN